MVIKKCIIKNDENKCISINGRGGNMIEFGYNGGGDKIEIVFTEGNTA